MAENRFYLDREALVVLVTELLTKLKAKIAEISNSSFSAESTLTERIQQLEDALQHYVYKDKVPVEGSDEAYGKDETIYGDKYFYDSIKVDDFSYIKGKYITGHEGEEVGLVEYILDLLDSPNTKLVHTVRDETIAGEKHFTDRVEVIDSTLQILGQNGYLQGSSSDFGWIRDGEGTSLESILSNFVNKEDTSVVHTEGSETINGNKNFTGDVTTEDLYINANIIHTGISDFSWIINDDGDSIQDYLGTKASLYGNNEFTSNSRNIFNGRTDFKGVTTFEKGISLFGNDASNILAIDNGKIIFSGNEGGGFSDIINSDGVDLQEYLDQLEVTLVHKSGSAVETINGTKIFNGNLTFKGNLFIDDFSQICSDSDSENLRQYIADEIAIHCTGGGGSIPEGGLTQSYFSDDVNSKLNSIDNKVSKSGDTITGTLTFLKNNQSVLDIGMIEPSGNPYLSLINNDDRSYRTEFTSIKFQQTTHGGIVTIQEGGIQVDENILVGSSSSGINLDQTSIKIKNNDTLYTTLDGYGLTVSNNSGRIICGNSKLTSSEILSPSIKKVGGTANDILLGNGSTTSLSSITQSINAKQDTISDLSTIRTNASNVLNQFDNVSYDSTNKLIIFKHGNTQLKTLDATPFISDNSDLTGLTNVIVDTPSSGDNAGVQCLIMIYNTSNGEKTVEIPLTDLGIDLTNYYTKSQVDALIVDGSPEQNGNHDKTISGYAIQQALREKQNALTVYPQGNSGVPLGIGDYYDQGRTIENVIWMQREDHGVIQKILSKDSLLEVNNASNSADWVIGRAGDYCLPTFDCVREYIEGRLSTLDLLSVVPAKSAANKNYLSMNDTDYRMSFTYNDDNLIPTCGAVSTWVKSEFSSRQNRWDNKIESITINGGEPLEIVNRNVDIIINNSGGNSGGSGIASGVSLWGNPFDGSTSVNGNIDFGLIQLEANNKVLTIKNQDNQKVSLILEGDLQVKGNITATGNVTAYQTSNSSSGSSAFYFDGTHYLFLDNGVLKFSDNGTVKTVNLT